MAVDDSVFRRSGRKVWGAAWQHDGSSPARSKLSFGNCFVTAGIVVRLPFCARPACLPVLARLHVPGRGRAPEAAAAGGPGQHGHGRGRAGHPAGRGLPRPPVHVVADAHYHGPALRDLPAAGDVDDPAAEERGAVRRRRPGPQARPAPRKGPRLGTAADIAAAAAWTPATVHIYGRDTAEDLAEVTCLWYGCRDVITVRVILARDAVTTLALVTTDLAAPAAALVERYAAGGPSSRPSPMPATSWAPARPAPGPATPSSGPSRSRCWCTPW